MTLFISYAQNQEDVILWRALRDVGQGFYVDVGAADPTGDSVTRAFYDRGWSGINIEPTEEYHTRLKAERPRDVNLRVLAGAKPGMSTLHVMPGTGLSTTDAALAARQAEKGRQSIQETLPVVPLDGILGELGDRPIHFLKIDVEGAEREVLEGIDLTQRRPWIVVVEATEPETQVRTDHRWADLLLGRGYEFAIFDGLNCFYVANEHRDLKDLVAMPPNYFDGFRRASEQALAEQLAQTGAELQRLIPIEQSYQALRASLPDFLNLQADRDGLARQAAALEASRAEVMAAHDAATAETARLSLLLEEATAREARSRDEAASHLARALEDAAAKEAALFQREENLSRELAEARLSRTSMAQQLAQLRGALQQAQHDLAGSRAAQAELSGEVAALSRDLATATAERLQLRSYVDVLDQRVADWQTRFGEVFASTSWRVTAPVRRAGLLARKLRGRRTKDLQTHFADLPALPASPPTPAGLLTAPDATESEAELLRAALPERAGPIFARLEALARSDLPGA